MRSDMPAMAGLMVRPCYNDGPICNLVMSNICTIKFLSHAK